MSLHTQPSANHTRWDELETLLIHPCRLGEPKSTWQKAERIVLSTLAWVGTLFILPITVGIHHSVKYLQGKRGSSAMQELSPKGQAALKALENFEDNAIPLCVDAIQTKDLPPDRVRRAAKQLHIAIPQEMEDALARKKTRSQEPVASTPTLTNKPHPHVRAAQRGPQTQKAKIEKLFSTVEAQIYSCQGRSSTGALITEAQTRKQHQTAGKQSLPGLLRELKTAIEKYTGSDAVEYQDQYQNIIVAASPYIDTNEFSLTKNISSMDKVKAR